ncbi:hypothetical protein CBR_g3914 [Chara braunii]|uniref:Right handed beta helix domain-containing protein n=1 Tax=Chara braunii TaxID=69332 RepID=A0A388KGM9_CHABU|nr:hypothetical protein CBR_g3914 [Chara braunii]|eukprot:GBG69215.1 hypothetical protein CBR_g3914 [Chara braunii]
MACLRWTFLALQMLCSCLAMPSATVQVLHPASPKRITHADLVKAVTSTCSLVLTSDVVLRGDLPEVNSTACPEVRIVGRCRGRKLCRIDGAGKYSFIHGGERLLLKNLEITRMRGGNIGRAPVLSDTRNATIIGCRVTNNVDLMSWGVVRVPLTVKNTVFEGNQGGAIEIDDRYVYATDVVFRCNRRKKGAAVWNMEGRFYCTRCLFEGNIAEEKGGAVYLVDTDGTGAIFKSCRFVGNKVVGKGGVGGAVYMDNLDPGVSFCRCQFDRNMADGKLNHVYIDGLEDSIAYFCPARPRSGIVITPKTSEAFVKDGCQGCK